MSSLMSLNQVGYAFGSRTLFRDISLDIQPGQITSLIGYNGSGKSTLLQIMLGALQPTTGSLQKRPGLTIGYVPQTTSMRRPLPVSVRDFFAMYGVEKPAIKQLAQQYDLTDLLDRPLHGLSGGQLQRVLITNALAHDPDLILMDEPTAGLDIGAQEMFYQMIDQIMQRHGRSLVIVSHDIRTIYAKSTTVLCLHQGVCCAGKPSDQHLSDDVRRLFGEHVLPYHHHHHD